MKQMKYCLKKDIKEFLRKKKLFVFSMVMLAICFMVFITTLFVPDFLSALLMIAPEMLTDAEAMDLAVGVLFPNDLSGNMGMLSSEVTVFYMIVVVFMLQGILPKEIESGRWVVPISAGYNKKNLVISKAVVYATGTAIPVFLFYNLYYLLIYFVYTRNYDFGPALLNSLVLSIHIFSIAFVTVLGSTIVKKSWMLALSLMIFWMAGPEMFNYFTFGRYVFTHIVTHVNYSMTSFSGVILPLIQIILIDGLIFIIALKKADKIEVGR